MIQAAIAICALLFALAEPLPAAVAPFPAAAVAAIAGGVAQESTPAVEPGGHAVAGHSSDGHAAADGHGADSHGAADGHGAASPVSSSDMMTGIYQHLFAHAYTHEPYLQIGPIPFHFTNHNLALLIAATIVLLAFGWLARQRKKGGLIARGPLQNCLEALVAFVKNDMVYANMGEHHGRKFLPLFLTQFFCILIMNLFGILPNFDFFRSMHFPTTATANFWVTGGLALTTFTAILYGGIKEQGLGHYIVGLAPPIHLGDSAGMKLMRVAILCIMYPIEVMGLIIKPIALTIRLFANMLGGHLAMLTVYGLIYLFQSYAIGAVGVGFNAFLTFLELLVAFIQAYIFTYLSILFVGAAVHPEH